MGIVGCPDNRLKIGDLVIAQDVYGEGRSAETARNDLFSKLVSDIDCWQFATVKQDFQDKGYPLYRCVVKGKSK